MVAPALIPDAFESFHHGSIFNRIVFCLGEKQGNVNKRINVHVVHVYG